VVFFGALTDAETTTGATPFKGIGDECTPQVTPLSGLLQLSDTPPENDETG
jgi:hypothetical protein